MNKALKILLFVFSFLALALFSLISIFNKRLRITFLERVGLNKTSFVSDGRPIVLFHVASLGEFIGLKPLLEKVKQSEKVQIVLTALSDTGKDAALKSELADFVSILPFDNPWICSRFLDAIKPDLFVNTETELWPSLFIALHERKVPCIAVNARISDYTYPRYTFLSPVLRLLLKPFLEIHAQTAKDKSRFEEFGAMQVFMTGTSKFDLGVNPLSEEEKIELSAKYSLDQSRPVFIAGSVRVGEDKSLIQIFSQAKNKYKDLQLLIAPRHPENFSRVADLLSEQGLAFNRRTKAASKQADVFLLDTVGELSKAYQIADIAFVGGSLVDVGGHNPMEPAAFGLPIIMGLFTSTVEDIVEALKDAGGLVQVLDERQLSRQLCLWLDNTNAAKSAGLASKSVWHANIGASKRLADRVLFLSCNSKYS